MGRGEIELSNFEIQFIRDFCAKMSDQQLADRLNEMRRRTKQPLVSRWQVTKRRQRIGISKKEGGGIRNRHVIQRAAQLCDAAMNMAYKRLNEPVKRSGPGPTGI